MHDEYLKLKNYFENKILISITPKKHLESASSILYKSECGELHLIEC